MTATLVKKSLHFLLATPTITVINIALATSHLSACLVSTANDDDAEVFFIIQEKQMRPSWIFNYTCDDKECGYQFVPTRLLLRSEVPNHSQLRGSVLMQTGPCDSLLRSALWRGLRINLPELNSIRNSLRLPVLKKGQGTGKNKAVLKRDVAFQVVKHLFPEALQTDIERMVDVLAPVTRRSADTETDADIKQHTFEFMVSQLDVENQTEFKKVVFLAREELKKAAQARNQEQEELERELNESLKKELEEAKQKIDKMQKDMDAANVSAGSADAPANAPAPASRCGESHTKVTPREFRSLFAFAEKNVQGLSFKHDRTKLFAQVVFPCHLSSIHFRVVDDLCDFNVEQNIHLLIFSFGHTSSFFGIKVEK